MKTSLYNIYRSACYNTKIVFANKFVYFLISALGSFIAAVLIVIFSDFEITEATAYNLLLLPSVLMAFYPSCFGIQNDSDTKILELIFGLPDYRYKIWLSRIIMNLAICFVFVVILAGITALLLVDLSVMTMTFHVTVVCLFTSSLCFMLSTYVKNGNGAAVIFIAIGLLVFILNPSLEANKWNILFNPYDIPMNKRPDIFEKIMIQNRLILIAASLVMLVTGINSARNREKFLR